MNAGLNTISASDIERIKAESFVRVVECHRELPSTNDRALELATREGIETPMLVLAEVQTAGRGRGNNRWWSAPGGLTCSLVLDATKCQRAGASDPRLSVATALAVHDALGEYVSTDELKVKWPNDIYMRSRKVAGILLERSTACPHRLVVGVGINVNNSLAEAPDEIRQQATSLCDSTGTPTPVQDLLLTVLNRVDQRLQMLVSDGSRLPSEWQGRCWLRTHVVSVTSGERAMTGVCGGIDDQGALVIRNDSGVHHLSSGVVSRVE